MRLKIASLTSPTPRGDQINAVFPDGSSRNAIRSFPRRAKGKISRTQYGQLPLPHSAAILIFKLPFVPTDIPPTFKLASVADCYCASGCDDPMIRKPTAPNPPPRPAVPPNRNRSFGLSFRSLLDQNSIVMGVSFAQSRNRRTLMSIVQTEHHDPFKYFITLVGFILSYEKGKKKGRRLVFLVFKNIFWENGKRVWMSRLRAIRREEDRRHTTTLNWYNLRRRCERIIVDPLNLT